MNISRWFTKRSVNEEEKAPYVQDVSEPVVSFLKLFSENPRKFKLSKLGLEESSRGAGFHSTTYELTDTINNMKYRFTSSFKCGVSIIGHDWMTYEEKQCVIATISKYFSERGFRLGNIKRGRRDRRYRHQRQKYMEIYCK